MNILELHLKCFHEGINVSLINITYISCVLSHSRNQTPINDQSIQDNIKANSYIREFINKFAYLQN